MVPVKGLEPPTPSLRILFGDLLTGLDDAGYSRLNHYTSTETWRSAVA